MVRQTIDEGFSEAGEDGRWESWEGGEEKESWGKRMEKEKKVKEGWR